MQLTEYGIELVIDHPKFARLLRDGIITVREALQYLYCIQLLTEVYDFDRGIEVDVIYHHEKPLGKILFRREDTEALKRGETVRFYYCD